jgi:SPP1 gp7 family putative phage head morphogenesis protein
VKHEDWRTSKRAEQQYLRDLMQILQRYFTDASSGGEESSEAAPGAKKVHLLSISDWLNRYAWQAAQRMIVGRYVDTQKTWRHAARESMKGQLLYRALQQEMRGDVGKRVRELVRENALLISSLPQDVARQVTQMMLTREQKGLRAVTAESFIPHVIRWKARLIARTETSKATTALMQARSESLGLDYFVWRTSQDQRVRKSHRMMEGVIVKWANLPSPERLAKEKNPPAPYAAGNIYNCRCYTEALIRFEQVAWPHRYFVNNRIQYVTLAQFKKISNIQLPLAA